VKRFRESPNFAATIDAVARQLQISRAAVEKDYWVSEILRVLARDFSGDFVFKGGTSLSKRCRIIERFSKDIDILVIPGDRSRKAVHKLMKDMAQAAGNALGADLKQVSSETGCTSRSGFVIRQVRTQVQASATASC
jgi:predicted nucleotidyltransferase component of viral defense system